MGEKEKNIKCELFSKKPQLVSMILDQEMTRHFLIINKITP